ncbi:hypothetical protein FDENT_13119 [Fusarium denticulatum]|uniref:DNA2/NAM7 helicase-like C-terminal domain-containing protein n=1 Tax=Fusarium denticulatum TaxID=48507 RepID=A0A8H5T5L1_9HYPO|nr:hypothetical protein FDENT_13119 [Fusarium denticulatum]
MATPHRPQLPCNLVIRDADEGNMRVISASPNLAVNLNNKGLRLSFLRDQDRQTFSWYSADLTMTESALHHITIQLPPRGFTVNLLKLTSDEKSALSSHLLENSTGYRVMEINCKASTTVTGFGLPFHGANETVDSWVNQHTPIKDVISLPDILRQNTFTLLIKATTMEITRAVSTINSQLIAPDYGYGEQHWWDMDRYSKQIPRNRGSAFPPTIRFKNENERNTALTQTHVQDKIGTDSIEESVNFVCLLEPKGIFEPEHWRAAHRALRGDLNKVRVRFTWKERDEKKRDDKDRDQKSRDGKDRDKKGRTGLVIWEAVPLTFATCDELNGVEIRNRIALGLTRPSSGPGHDFIPIAYDDYETAKESRRENLQLRLESGLHGDTQRVNGIFRLSNGPALPTTMKSDPLAVLKRLVFNEVLIGKGLWELEKDGVKTTLPHFDLLHDVPPKVRDACLQNVFEDDRERVHKYFSKLHLGLGLISGPPGTGKSHLASAIVFLMCHNSALRQVYVSAASNGATDNILERIHDIATKTTSNLIDRGVDVKHLMLVRGYSLNTETENCNKVLFAKPLPEYGTWNPSPWKLEHSLCWWTLRVLGSATVPSLTLNDNAELFDLYERLSALASNSTPDASISKFRSLVKLAQGVTSVAQYQSKEKPDSHAKLVRQLMQLVLGCANVVATTPVVSACWIYRTFNDQAKAVVFDEAATLFCSDGLLVYGNTPRPMIAIGDPMQLAPVLSTAFELLQIRRQKRPWERWSDHHEMRRWPTNRFAGFAQISWLSWFIHLGWPVFHLYTQHRMAEDLFDLSLDTVYTSLKPHFKYSPMCRITNFPIGIDVEEYLQQKFKIPTPAVNTLAPVFFNCRNCPIRKYPDNESRLNPRQADLIADLLVDMIRELKLSPADIAVLTPYRANFRSIGKRFKKEPELQGVACSTFDTFQGREAQIVVLALCVTHESGPLFVGNPRSLNVALTRQRSSLLIFGDMGVLDYKARQTSSDFIGSDSGQRFNLRMFHDVLKTLRDSRRVVKLVGKRGVDYDGYWEDMERKK